MMSNGRRRQTLKLLGLMVLGFAAPARAFDFSLKVEPGLVVPLDQPQSRLFEIGGGATLKGLFGLGRYVDVGPSITFLGMPAASRAPSTDAGIAWAAGGGVRFKRPHDSEGPLRAISPWLDADALYVRTGPLNRFGFAVGAGFSFALDEARHYWLGPFARYFQIVQSERPAYDNTDAKTLIAGVSFEIDFAHRRPAAAPECVTAAPCPLCVACPPAVVSDRDHDGVPDSIDRCPDEPGPKETGGCPDRDLDGLTDNEDLCPDVPGPRDNRGCPVYAKVVVKQDKLELKEKIQFAFDQSTILADSHPLLDEVVKALKENRSFHVRIEGHTDSSGTNEHNQPLSEHRAQAVLEYLVSHGVERERHSHQGFGHSVPLDTNATEAGREANRRVEFVIIKKERSGK